MSSGKWWPSCLGLNVLTHWGLNTMAAILQITFSKAFFNKYLVILKGILMRPVERRSSLVQALTWCHQARSQHQIHCGSTSLLYYCTARRKQFFFEDNELRETKNCTEHKILDNHKHSSKISFHLNILILSPPAYSSKLEPKYLFVHKAWRFCAHICIVTNVEPNDISPPKVNKSLFLNRGHIPRYNVFHYKNKTVMRLSYLYNGNCFRMPPRTSWFTTLTLL